MALWLQGKVMMKEQHTERENKWHDANLKSQAPALAVILKLVSRNNPNGSHGGLSVGAEIQSIFIYYVATLLIFPLFYGHSYYDLSITWLLDVFASNQGYEVMAGSFNMAMYFICCSIINVFCIAYLGCKLLLDYQNASHITKILSVIYCLLFINNMAIAVDAFERPYPWPALIAVDDLINGNSEWLVPIGIADLILMPICVLCIAAKGLVSKSDGRH